MTGKIVILTACASAEEGRRIARSLVEARLAACVSVIPSAVSVYRWKDRMEESEEAVLLIKSTRAVFGRLKRELLKLHSYEVPELLALPVVDGSEAYLKWIEGEIVKEDRT